jgi:sugar phosphate isomerase/epimerase
MQYGICGGPEIGGVAAEAGYDYFEWSVPGFLKPRESKEAFHESLEAVRNAPLPCPVLNCFIPDDLKITGPNADLEALEQYATMALQRAEEAGVEVIVFGSGGARRIPDGFDRETALRQIVDFCRMLGPIARRHGVTVAIEPLNRADCNVLNTVGECAAVVREVDHPALRLLVDSYHWAKDHDSLDDIVTHGDLLSHVHIATNPNRLSPGIERCEFVPFFDALAKAGYRSRVSIEARIPDPVHDLTIALFLMTSLAKEKE